MKKLIFGQFQQNENDINKKYRVIRQKRLLLNLQQKKVFEYLIYNNLQIDIKKVEQKKIILNGVPQIYKQLVWTQLIKNNHGITAKLYDNLLYRRDNLVNQIFWIKKLNQDRIQKLPYVYLQKVKSQQKINKAKSQGYLASEQLNLQMQKVTRWLQTIELDIPRTFSQLKIFQNQQQFHLSKPRKLQNNAKCSKSLIQDDNLFNMNNNEFNIESKMLYNVLSLFVLFRQDIGYRQGMSQIAGHLIVQLNNQFKSFQLFCSIITSDVLYEFFTINLQYINVFCLRLSYKLRQKCPQLYEFFDDNKLDYKIFILDWIFCLFTKSFQLDTVNQIWDILLLYNLDEKILILLIIQILITFQNHIIHNFNTIYDQDIMIVANFLKKIKIDELRSDKILDNLRQIKF